MAKNVLVVDDEPGIVKMVESRLKAAGYGVVTATGGEEALRVCRETKPDVAVLDVMMPGMPGDHVAQAMREDSTLRDIPVIFLTALVRKQGAPLDDVYLKGPVAGFYYLAKPFKGSELLEMLGKVLNEASKDTPERLVTCD